MVGIPRKPAKNTKKMSEVHSQHYFLTPLQRNPGYPLFIFLPGLGETTQLAPLQTAGLETAFNVRCLVLPPQELPNWDILSQRVIDLIQAELETEQPKSVYLCGECFGGCLALKILLKAPRLFDRVILINPASSLNLHPWIDWILIFTDWLPQPIYQLFSVAFLPFLASLERIKLANSQVLLKAVKSASLKASAQRLSLLSQFKIENTQLHQFTQPFLIITSKFDRLLPSLEEAQRLVRNLTDARTVTLPNSGHACLLEEGINLLEIMKSANFLDNLYPVESQN